MKFIEEQKKLEDTSSYRQRFDIDEYMERVKLEKQLSEEALRADQIQKLKKNLRRGNTKKQLKGRQTDNSSEAT